MSTAHRMMNLEIAIVTWSLIQLLLITSATLNIVITGILDSGKPTITVVIKEKR